MAKIKHSVLCYAMEYYVFFTTNIQLVRFSATLHLECQLYIVTRNQCNLCNDFFRGHKEWGVNIIADRSR